MRHLVAMQMYLQFQFTTIRFHHNLKIQNQIFSPREKLKWILLNQTNLFHLNQLIGVSKQQQIDRNEKLVPENSYDGWVLKHL